MLAWWSKNNLSAFQLDWLFRFSTTPPSYSTFRKGSTSHITRCIVENPHPEISSFLQDGFSHITQEIVGKALHALCLKAWTHLCIFHSNTLTSMYSKFRNMDYARVVFDEMPVRNEASWNNMMSVYVKMGLHVDACRVFTEMRNRGFELNGYSIPSFLTAVCRSGSMLSEGLQMHGLVLKNAAVHDVFVGTSLLHFYGSYGLVTDARMIFEEMPVRNAVSWTSLMDSYACAGLFNEVVNLYRRMRAEANYCDQNTFATVIRSCGALDDEFSVHQVLGHVVKYGLLASCSIANSLIMTFGNFNNVESAIYVFDSVDEHDAMLWNSIITALAHSCFIEESFKCFHLMRLNHSKVDEITVSTVLSICDSVGNSKCGRGVHGSVVKLGLEFDIRLSNSLLKMYFKTERYEDAEKLFYYLPQKDLVSWNSMMAGYVSQGKCFDALRVFRELLCTGSVVNFVTLVTALSSCANSEFLSEGSTVHALAITSGLCESTIVGNALVTMYGKCGMTQEAKMVFQNMPEKELVTWNALIGSYAKNKKVDEAIKTFNAMREGDVLPDCVTLIHVLQSCCDYCYLLGLGMPLHAHILLTGFASDEYVINSLISMYATCGDLDLSNSIFCSLVSRTSETWNAMVAAKAHNGQYEEALKLLVQMQKAEVGVDRFTISAALSASANSGVLEEGQQLHGLAIKHGFGNYHFIVNAAMDMYAKCGELNNMLKLLPDPKRRSRLSWNILISAFARHGHFLRAEGIFHEMVAHGVEPDNTTFLAVLSACSHGGLVDKGLGYFASMTSQFGIRATIKHCVCVVDLLGRFGRLAEAEAFITEMPVPPNDAIWRTLLAACEIHGDMEHGKKAATRLLETNPSDDSAYVLYSNICATSGRWQDVQALRDDMEAKNVKKNPARSFL